MSLKDEIEHLLVEYKHNEVLFPCQVVDKIISKIEKRIDELIEIDNQTMKRKSWKVYDEGRIAAQASKNTLILVKEMLK